MRHVFAFILFLGFTLSTAASHAQWFRYPKPEGVPFGYWKTTTWEWAYSSRSIQITTTDGTQYQGLLLGAYDSGIALMDGAYQPFVEVEGSQIRLIAPDSIAKIKLKTLNYQWHHLAIANAIGTAITYPAFAALGGPIAGLYGATISSIYTAGAIAAAGQVVLPYTRWYRLNSSLSPSYERLQGKLKRFEQVDNWQAAQTLPTLVPTDPVDPDTYHSLFPVMPKVARAFRPRPWSFHLTFPIWMASTLERDATDSSNPLASDRANLGFTRVPQLSIRYQAKPRMQYGLHYQPLSTDILNQWNQATPNLPYRSAYYQFQLHSVQAGADYTLVGGHPYLKQRHRLTAGIGAGLLWGTQKNQWSILTGEGGTRTLAHNVTNEVLRPVLQSRLTYTYAITKSIGFQAELTALTAGNFTEPESRYVEDRFNLDFFIEEQKLRLNFITSNLGLVVRL